MQNVTRVLVGAIVASLVAVAVSVSAQTPTEIAAEFVRLNVDVIVTSGPAVSAAKQATSVTPIIFARSGDPVVAGLVASLARSGGNVTGLSQQIPEAAGKRVQLLREALPSFRRLAIMVNVGERNSVLDAREDQAAARTLGLEVTTLEIRRAEDIAPAFGRSRAARMHSMSWPTH